MIIGLLHPGRMGAAIGDRLQKAGHTVLWDPKMRSEATSQRAETSGLTPATLEEMAARATLVISVCPSAAAIEVARSVAQQRYGGLFVDANAVSPSRMRQIGDLVTDGGVTVIDAAISGPPPTDTSSPKVFLAGPADESSLTRQIFETAGLSAEFLGENLGAASALKMALISYQRSARLLAALAHGLADHNDVTEALIREAARIGASGLSDRNALSGTAARAWRWVPELHEAASSLEECDLPTGLAAASAQLYELLAPTKDDWTITPERVIRMLRQP